MMSAADNIEESAKVLATLPREIRGMAVVASLTSAALAQSAASGLRIDYSGTLDTMRMEKSRILVALGRVQEAIAAAIVEINSQTFDTIAAAESIVIQHPANPIDAPFGPDLVASPPTVPPADLKSSMTVTKGAVSATAGCYD